MLVRILGGDGITEPGGYNASIIAEFRASHGQYAEQARRYPGFADCERKTARIIPVIALTPVGGARKGN